MVLSRSKSKRNLKLIVHVTSITGNSLGDGHFTAIIRIRKGAILCLCFANLLQTDVRGLKNLRGDSVFRLLNVRNKNFKQNLVGRIGDTLNVARGFYCLVGIDTSRRPRSSSRNGESAGIGVRSICSIVQTRRSNGTSKLRSSIEVTGSAIRKRKRNRSSGKIEGLSREPIDSVIRAEIRSKDLCQVSQSCRRGSISHRDRAHRDHQDREQQGQKFLVHRVLPPKKIFLRSGLYPFSPMYLAAPGKTDTVVTGAQSPRRRRMEMTLPSTSSRGIAPNSRLSMVLVR